jgi:histidine ammonia-lyase
VVETEINSVTDNPLIVEDKIVSGGNFHGQPVAIAADLLGIALCGIGGISERRTARLLAGKAGDLPRFLTRQAGVSTGLMIAQYTAACLVSENKILASPDSIDSIPVSAGQEDHVSMGTIAAQNAFQIVSNVEHILAIELLCAAQAADFRSPSKLGRGTRQAHGVIRRVIPKLEQDREVHIDIERMTDLVRDGTVVHAVRQVVGKFR